MEWSGTQPSPTEPKVDTDADRGIGVQSDPSPFWGRILEACGGGRDGRFLGEERPVKREC